MLAQSISFLWQISPNSAQRSTDCVTEKNCHLSYSSLKLERKSIRISWKASLFVRNSSRSWIRKRDGCYPGRLLYTIYSKRQVGRSASTNNAQLKTHSLQATNGKTGRLVETLTGATLVVQRFFIASRLHVPLNLPFIWIPLLCITEFALIIICEPPKCIFNSTTHNQRLFRCSYSFNELLIQKNAHVILGPSGLVHERASRARIICSWRQSYEIHLLNLSLLANYCCSLTCKIIMFLWEMR